MFQPGAHCALGGRRLGGNRRSAQSCQAHHAGLVVEGRLHVEMDDGLVLDLGPNDVFDIPSGHDGWVVGGAPMHSINWSGVRSWLPAPESGERVVATILFTGEVEVVGDDVRGIAVHEAARIASAASGGEILVSSTTYQLASGAGLTFEEKGARELKGLSGLRSLYAVAAG